MVNVSTKTASFNNILDYLSNNNIDNDQIYIANEISWKSYQLLLQELEDYSHFKVSYDQGLLQIMSPSSRHEIYKKVLEILVETYCLEKKIKFYPLGSTTFKSEKIAKGIEPDQCYCIGNKENIPHLAIEVIITSGGINSLDIYQALGVNEVWFWENQQLTIYCLKNNQYFQSPQSQLFPQLDIGLLNSYLEWDEPFDAILDFRQKLREV